MSNDLRPPKSKAMQDGGRSQRELSEKFERQANTFKAFGRLLAKRETFKDMGMAAVCIGLAEVAEALAQISLKKVD